MDVLHSCRCCLGRAPDKDLTTPYKHLGTTEIYSDMLKECFEIHLILDSDDKVGICDVCVRRLRDASNFKLQVQRSQIELHAWLQGALQVKEEEPAVESIMEDGDGSGEDPVLYGEAPVKTETEDEDGTNDEEGQELLREEAPVKTETEDEDGTSDEEGQELLQPAVGVGVESDDGAEDAILFAWPGAGAGAEPARPVSARAREQFTLACSVKRDRLRGDEAPHASQASLATSRRGPRRATSMQDMPDDTAGLRAKEQAHTCCICGEHFTKKSTLIKHIKAHGTQTEICMKYSCKKHEHATEALRTQKNLNKRIYPNDKSYTCNTCEKEFKYSYYFNRHLRTHTGQKPYMCDVCDKTFADSSTLRRHRQIHTGIQPYTCSICSKKFTHKGDMVRHLRIHTGHKPYTCDVCSKTFGDRSHLRKHQQTHTSDKSVDRSRSNKFKIIGI